MVISIVFGMFTRGYPEKWIEKTTPSAFAMCWVGILQKKHGIPSSHQKLSQVAGQRKQQLALEVGEARKMKVARAMQQQRDMDPTWGSVGLSSDCIDDYLTNWIGGTKIYS